MSAPAGRTLVVRRGHTVVPNATVYDERLSYAALGLLTVLIARPETDAHGNRLPMGYRALAGRGMGEKATRDALAELDAAGYRHLFTTAAGRKGMRTDVVISDEPLTREEAEVRLFGEPLVDPAGPVDNQPHRAARGAARTDLRKQGVSAGPIVRHVSQHDASRHDEPRHRSYALQGAVGRSSHTPGNPMGPCSRIAAPGARCTSCPPAAPECEHGTPHDTRCAVCVAATPKF